MKKIVALTALSMILFTAAAQAQDNCTSLERNQSPLIQRTMAREKRTKETADIISLLNRLDSNYGYLYDRINSGKKIVVFIDPAHGKLPSGRWQGEVTERLSATGLPEEYYSIRLSRELYRVLSSNSNIEVRSTENFIKALKGETEEYDNIPFSETVRLANESDAFIILSEHLNNVSVILKAGGHANIPGLHVIRYRGGTGILTFINGTYSGFLTLYNKFDASGFCRDYALLLKDNMIASGFEPNSWDFGAVPDDRFSYFTDYPLSIIYETGFISNPREEKMLLQADNIQKIINSQYMAFIDCIRDFTGVDISSGSGLKKTGEPDRYRLDLMKLSRIAVYYIKNEDTDKALSSINDMRTYYGNSAMGDMVSYYSRIGQSIRYAEDNYALGIRYRNKKNYSRSRKYFRQAKALVYRTPLLSTYFEKYSRYTGGRRFIESDIAYDPAERKKRDTAGYRVSISRPVILPVEEGQSLEDAVYCALEPTDPETGRIIADNLKNAYSVSWRKTRIYSKTKKRYINSQQKITESVALTKGIFIIQLDRKLRVTSVRKVGSVYLDPACYQNQQFLKNSYFASANREKSL